MTTPIDKQNQRIQQLKTWIDENRQLIQFSRTLEVTISIKDSSIRGKITHFPDSQGQNAGRGRNSHI